MDNNPNPKNQSGNPNAETKDPKPLAEARDDSHESPEGEPRGVARDDSHESHTAPLPVVGSNSNKSQSKAEKPKPLAEARGDSHESSVEPPENLPVAPEPTSVAPDDSTKSPQKSPHKSLPKRGLGDAVQDILSRSNLDQNTAARKKILSEEVKSSLRTYEGDVAAAIRDKKASVASIRAAEEDKRDKIKQTGKDSVVKFPGRKSRLNWNKIFIGLLVLLLVLGGVVIVINIFSGDTKPKDVQKFEENIVSPQEFFFIDEQIEFPIDGLSADGLRNALGVQKGNTVATLGEIAHVYFTEKRIDSKRLIPFREFMGALDIKLPGSLLRHLDDSFMYGLHAFDGNEPFLILKTSSYGNAFSGMLAWEETLDRDMKGIFTPANEEILQSATSTSIILNLNYDFKDKIIQNRDTRLIENEEEEILLLYSFVNTDTIVITTNESTLKEIISRLERIRFAR